MSKAMDKWFDNKHFHPFRELAHMDETFERMRKELANWRREANGESSFTPSCDILEEDNQYIMKFDLPGVTRDQVHVEAENDVLTVRAERREEKKSDSKKRHLSEVFYGSYVRSFNLPGLGDGKKINAKFENGVLTVTVPKPENPSATQIPVQ